MGNGALPNGPSYRAHPRLYRLRHADCIEQCPLSGVTRKTFAKRRETGKEQRVQVSYDEGVAIHIGPESCAVAREGFGEALTGVRIGQPLSRERSYSGCRRRAFGGRQHIRARHRERQDDPAWSETLACADAPCTGTGRSRDRPLGNSRRSAAGRRGAVADDARSREVRLCHSSSEADEQSGPDRSGAGGAKGRGQGERAPAKHAPDTGTGARGTSAGARTASRKATEEGEVHCTPPPHQHRLPADGVLRAQTRCRLRGGWTDVADLRSRP